MKRGFILAAFLAATAAFGCVVVQPTIAPPASEAHAEPLPFKGRLADGDPAQLPPSVAMSLSDTSPVSFLYREELTHEDHHSSMAWSALNPLTYAGYPTGEYAVTAFASLSIVEGEKVLGDYTAQVHLSESYNLYAEPTHKELDDAARAAARRQVDRYLYNDRDRLAQQFANPAQTATGAAAGK